MARITIDGQTYEADDDTLKKMAADGVKYSAAPEPKGFWSDKLETLGDTLRGGAHGASFGIVDAPLFSGKSLPEVAGLAPYSQVKERSPIASTVGDVAGSLATPLGEIGVAAKGAGTLARMGRAAFGAGTEALTREASESQDPAAAASAAGIGAAEGAGGSLLASAVGGLLKTDKAAKIANAIGDIINTQGSKAVNKSFGLGVKEAKALAQKNGGKYDPNAIAGELEQLVPLGSGPTNAATKADVLEAAQKASGEKIGASLDRAGEAEGLNSKLNPTLQFAADGAVSVANEGGPWSRIQSRMQASADAAPRALEGERAAANALQRNASGLANEAAPRSMSDWHGRVSDFGNEAYGADKANKAVSTLENTATSKSANEAYKISRDELQQFIEQNASPATTKEFNEGMKGYSDVTDYARAARARGISEAAQDTLPGGAVALATPLIQAGIGAGVGGYATGDIKGALAGAATGFGTGLATAAHSGTRNYLTQMLSNSEGYDKIAQGLRGVSAKMGRPAIGPNAVPVKLQALGDALARQGNRKGLLQLEGMLASNRVRPDEEQGY